VADEQTHTETSTDQTVETTAETVTEGGKQTTEATEESTEGTALGGDVETTESGETEGETAKEGPPETYELTPPEGFEKLDPDAVAAATPVFKELNLTNEQANKLMPVAGEFAKKIIAERDQQLLGEVAATRKNWLEEAKADPEVGGANWDTSLEAAAKAMDSLGFPKGSPLRNYLNESGAGNHVEMIRLMAKVGKAIGEDMDFVRGNQNSAVKKTDEELFYGPKG
jgi:hypothetical protein